MQPIVEDTNANGRPTHRLSNLYALTFLLFIAVGTHFPRSEGSAGEITVRILDAKTGKPLAKLFVSAFAWNPAADLKLHAYSFGQQISSGTTDNEGRAVVHLSAQPGDQIGLDVRASAGDLYGCWERKPFSLKVILNTGLVAEYNASKCGKLRWQPSAKPGEIVLIDRKLTLWDHVRRETP
jgi:5-hydroxyisourate hydrolase-like protein (transthyretin family)